MESQGLCSGSLFKLLDTHVMLARRLTWAPASCTGVVAWPGNYLSVKNPRSGYALGSAWSTQYVGLTEDGKNK